MLWNQEPDRVLSSLNWRSLLGFPTQDDPAPPPPIRRRAKRRRVSPAPGSPHVEAPPAAPDVADAAAAAPCESCEALQAKVDELRNTVYKLRKQLKYWRNRRVFFWILKPLYRYMMTSPIIWCWLPWLGLGPFFLLLPTIGIHNSTRFMGYYLIEHCCLSGLIVFNLCLQCW